MSAWLPDLPHRARPGDRWCSPGLLTKVGVYAIIRAHSLLFPAGGLNEVLLVAALLTMLVGILGRDRAERHQTVACRSLWSATSVTWCSGSRCPAGSACRAPSTTRPTIHRRRPPCSWSSGSSNGRPGMRPPAPARGWPPRARCWRSCSGPRAQPRRHTAVSGFIGKVALLEAGSQDGSVLAWLLVGGSGGDQPAHAVRGGRVWTRRSGGPAPTPLTGDSRFGTIGAAGRLFPGRGGSTTAATSGGCRSEWSPDNGSHRGRGVHGGGGPDLRFQRPCRRRGTRPWPVHRCGVGNAAVKAWALRIWVLVWLTLVWLLLWGNITVVTSSPAGGRVVRSPLLLLLPAVPVQGRL